MTVRVLFLGEGTSDGGIIPQIEVIAARLGIDIAVTDPDLSRLPKPPGRAVSDKLRAVLDIDGEYELIAVHRDADRDGRQVRLTEIATAIQTHAPGTAHAAIVPVRMTEAWLLMDEAELRTIAGNPNGKMRLSLPSPNKVESVPDPKTVLKEKLALASGLSGRKLEKFNQRFSQHRRLLLERIDPSGPITDVSSWQHFIADMETGLKSAGRSMS
ncbi:hypothetical protein ACFHYQ_07485 [Sphaerimonospora cavernae]|uniref:DUF4276 family protein n=1 Tax=Sphaerimonospora cavernae TaxID=1740611 RepID=A0ABV6U4U0_9ACTN